LLNKKSESDKHASRMRIYSHILGRNLRLLLLLALLGAQGVASAHELEESHSAQSHICSICIAGIGLGAAIPVQACVPQVRVCQNAIPVNTVNVSSTFYYQLYSSRAPPSVFSQA
jgi:hypothetical protein